MIKLYISTLISLLFIATTAFCSNSDSFCVNGVHRAWWDVLHYELHVSFDIDKQSIEGYNIITSNTLIEEQSIMQIDMQLPMVIDSVKPAGGALKANKKSIPFIQEDNVCYIMIPFDGFKKDEIFKVKIFFHGQPPIAANPPWDAGFVISKDVHDNPWWGVTCQNSGASVWWPCKDLKSDEPDNGVDEYYEIPKNLKAVGNGKLEDVIHKKHTDVWIWKTTYPINLYDVTFYIGNYEHWSDSYMGISGLLPLDYYILPENIESSKLQFIQVNEMLACFEGWLGPYPFYRDGYKLIDAPYLGMEHQSAIAYGNQYKNGYNGRDRSGTGYGLDFDFIIVHESAHEWFGNSISASDIADNWIHEGFASYAEMLFEECIKGKTEAFAYQGGKRAIIKNDKPVQGKYNSCDAGSLDCYEKGAMLLHTIRMMLNDDVMFKNMLHTLNDSFRYKTIATDDVLNLMNAFTQKDFSTIFQQFLQRTEPPTLALMQSSKDKIAYRWMNCVDGFNMPVKLIIKKEELIITPTSNWQELPMKADKKNITLSQDYYVKEMWLKK